jgi:hypothetical protein
LEPFDVALTGGFDVEDQELRCLVAVEVVEAGFEGVEAFRAGLEEEDGFSGGFDVAFPVEDGLDGGDKRSAGSELLFNKGTAGLCGFVGRGAGSDDEANGWPDFGRGFGHLGFLEQCTRGEMNCPRNVHWRVARWIRNCDGEHSCLIFQSQNEPVEIGPQLGRVGLKVGEICGARIKLVGRLKTGRHPRIRTASKLDFRRGERFAGSDEKYAVSSRCVR